MEFKIKAESGTRGYKVGGCHGKVKISCFHPPKIMPSPFVPNAVAMDAPIPEPIKIDRESDSKAEWTIQDAVDAQAAINQMQVEDHQKSQKAREKTAGQEVHPKE